MGLNKIILRLASAAMLLGAFSFTGCGNVFEDKADGIEYGSLVWETEKDSPFRALSVGDVKYAVVSVAGNGISSAVKSSAVAVSGGKGSAEVKNIPVGKNRIVTVQGYSDSSATTKISDAVLRAVVDIASGVNTISEISWETSRKGYVYNALLEDGVDISSLSEGQISTINNAIPEVDAANINLPLFASDFAKGSGTLQASSAYILSAEKTLKRLVVSVSSDSTESEPCFTASAYYSDGTNSDVSGDSGTVWTSSKTSVATVSGTESGGKVTLVSAGTAVVSATYTYGGTTKTGAKQTLTVKSSGTGLAVYVLENYNEVSGGGYIYAWKGSDKVYGEWPGTKMSLTSDDKAYYQIIEEDDISKVASLIFNNNSKQSSALTLPSDSGHWLAYYNTSKSSWDWKEYTEGNTVSLPDGGTLTATIDSEVVTEPLPPTVKIAPASGNVSTSGTITVSYEANGSDVTSASVSANSKRYSLSDFSGGKLTVKVSDLGITEAGKTIAVSASVTNSEGTTNASANLTTVLKAQVPDTFTWDNANVYFVLTDRFKNGDKRNDHSYYRQNADNNATLNSGYNNVATFHGGDIKGLTEELDYLDRLGVNAIWITAPYEQTHGWCSGGGNGFPHYAFHGYYTQDWTYMDQNMGTIEEFRTFVNEAHSRGIRVVMDVVMNHTGYNTVEDMITYDFGNFKAGQTPGHGWLGSGTWKDNHDITNYTEQGKWGNWWGAWVRAFGDQSWHKNAGYQDGGSGDITGSLTGLPDVVTERTASVSIPTFLKTKWTNEIDSKTIPSETGNTTGNKYGDYKLSSVSNVDWNGKNGDWRTDNKGAPADYQIVWLSAWVREFGIDGFRCDTAKHVEKNRWKQLKQACQSALDAWRKDSSKIDDSGAKGWDESFWMTGEAWGWTSDSSYYTDGGFDSMINFAFNGNNKWDGNYRTRYPSESDWASYISINSNPQDSDNNGNRNNKLSYISSHDTGLTRVGDQYEVGTGLVLLPGGVQIYYGDESYREKAYTDCGDGDMMTRGDMNLESAKSSALVSHWGKVGTFRKYNPAVGAGTGSATKRTYNGSAGESKVAIGISGSSVDVSNLFADGTTVYNWYDGKSASVSSGSVSFSGGTKSQPILVSDRNPADYGVSF